jgi:hypothetical protein
VFLRWLWRSLGGLRIGSRERHRPGTSLNHVRRLGGTLRQEPRPGLDIADEVRRLAANYLPRLTGRNAQVGPEKRWMVSMNWATWMGFAK